MPQGAKDAFKAEPQSAGEFFTRAGEHFYVPVYQRPYSWRATDDVQRLFVDVTEGISDLLSDRPPDVLMFIGALILVEDRKKEQILPIVRDQVPAKVNIVIDGQQRCTTLLVWACVLLERIAICLKGMSQHASQPGYVNLVDSANQTARLLELMVHDDARGSEAEYSFYPRMIRSHDDQWSKRPNEAQYVSPLARLLRRTSEWIRCGKEGKLGYSIDELERADRSDHEPVQRALQFLSRRCENFAAGSEFEGNTPPSPADMAKYAHFQEELWGNPWDPALTDVICARTEVPERYYRSAVSLARVIALANFILHKVCFTVVRSDRESWAFDVFDALNTTGQPLTAFETFRPLVISDIGLGKYRESVEYAYLERIHEFLTAGSDKKTKRTEKLIIHAGLLERGEKLPKRLAAQRQWLKGHYQQLDGREGRRDFLAALADLAEFTEIFASPKKHLQLCHEQETLLALLQLSDANHDIVIPILSRFYSFAKSCKGEGARDQAFEELRAAIRATAAFSTLWRLAHGGTQKIDDCFRALMRGQTLANGDDVGPFAMRLPGRQLTSGAYVADLRGWLGSVGLDSEDAWVQATIDRPVYSESPQFARLFLAAAMHNSIPDPAQPGLLKQANAGTCPMLAADAPWYVNEYQIEHVAPQAGAAGGWDESIYRQASLVHSAGNLTLLPASVNAAIKNWVWDKKRAVMQLLASSTQEEAVLRRQNATEVGTLTEFPTLDEIISNAKFHSHLLAIANRPNWDEDAIRRRGENLCRLGYRQLSRWLPR
jgi:hypothetical protein